jgi:hypothetical protein
MQSAAVIGGSASKASRPMRLPSELQAEADI